MAQLRFSYPFRSKSPRILPDEAEKLCRTSHEALQWFSQALEEAVEHLRTQLSCPETENEAHFQGLFGVVHHTLTALESTIEGLCFRSRKRHTESELKTALSKAFSQVTNTIWAQISFSVRSSPNMKLEAALKALEEASSRAREMRANYESQLQECEECLRASLGSATPKHGFDSVDTQRMDWDEPTNRQTQRIIRYLSSYPSLDFSSPHMYAGLHALVQDCCASRREQEVVRELEREIEKVRWRADVLARSLREAHRGKSEVACETEQMISEIKALKARLEVSQSESEGLREEVKSLAGRNQRSLEDLRRKLSVSEASLRSLQDQVQQVGDCTAAFESRVLACVNEYEVRLARLAVRLSSIKPRKSGPRSEKFACQLHENTVRLQEQSAELSGMSQQIASMYQLLIASRPSRDLSLSLLPIINLFGEAKQRVEIERLETEVTAVRQQLQEAAKKEQQDVKDLQAAKEQTHAVITQLTEAKERVTSLQAAMQVLEKREGELAEAWELATTQRASSEELASNMQQQLKHAQELLSRWSAAFSATPISPEDAAAVVARLQQECRELREERSDSFKEEQLVTAEDVHTRARDLEQQLREMEEEHVLLSKENFEFLKQVDDFRSEKAKNSVLLADLQATLEELEKGWAEAKRREKEMEAELQSLTESLERAHQEDPKRVDSEHVRRILDEIEEKDKELLHLRTLAGTYREQVALLRTQLSEKEDENQSLEEQQMLVLQELEVLQQPLEQVVIEAAHKAAELVLLQKKFAAETQKVQQLADENSALEAKNRLLKSTLAEFKSAERVLVELGSPKEKSLDFGEEGISSVAEGVNKSVSEDLHTLLGLDEAAEVCRKVAFASKEWVLVRLPKGCFCWVTLGAPETLASEQLAAKFHEVQRLVHAYQPATDVTLAVSHALCLLERAKLLQKSSLAFSMEATTLGTQVDSEHLQELVLRLLRQLPSLPVEAEAVVRAIYSALGVTQ